MKHEYRDKIYVFVFKLRIKIIPSLKCSHCWYIIFIYVPPTCWSSTEKFVVFPIYIFMSVRTNIAMTWWFWPISKTASALNSRALCPESDKSIVFLLRVIKRNEAFWLYVKISMWVGECIFFNLKQYLWSWSVISLRIIRSPDVLRATAAFEMAVIFPMTSTLRKDCQSWYLNRWWRLHLMSMCRLNGRQEIMCVNWYFCYLGNDLSFLHIVVVFRLGSMKIHTLGSLCRCYLLQRFLFSWSVLTCKVHQQLCTQA